MSFAGERATRSHSFVVALASREAFALFEPEGERAWAQGWDPQYVHPRDGRAEAGMVFTTDHGGENTIWIMTRHEPAAGLVEYVRTTPGSRIATVMVQCAPLGPLSRSSRSWASGFCGMIAWAKIAIRQSTIRKTTE